MITRITLQSMDINMLAYWRKLLAGAVVLGILGAAGIAQTASARSIGPAGKSQRANLFVTPASMAPGAYVHAVVHLRSVTASTPVEVQISPPAPAIGTLVDLHTRATTEGALDQPVAFAATNPGAYIVFVNLGRYADPHSTFPGSSMQTVLPIAASFPLLAFPCGAPVQATVACQLSGYGFIPGEKVTITYHITVTTFGSGARTLTYRRTTTISRQGSFTRPILRFAVDPRVLSYRATVTVTGARGDHASISAAGTP